MCKTHKTRLSGCVLCLWGWKHAEHDEHAQKGVFVVFEREGRWRDATNT